MALSFSSKTFSTKVSKDYSTLVAEMNTFFATPKIIYDVTVDLNVRNLTVYLIYADGAGITYEASAYATSNAVSADAQFNASIGVDPTRLPQFVLDVTSIDSNSNHDQQVLAICGNLTTNPSLLGLDNAVFIAQADALIAAGASGLCTIYDTTGAVIATAATVFNVSITAWPQGQRNYMVFDAVNGVFIGIPSCCGTSALTTTPPP
jgi:hypothetical protein